ncbi:hypothetical protein ACFWWT_06655 [Streptomyces sp. NPDC058676]|uniref:hypothetical protein n=1 Tax=unclassified Streptomyces TaxID=2593676 RepID=UPI0036502950
MDTTGSNTPYVFLVAANNPVPASDPQALGLPADAEMTSTIRLSSARRPEDTPLARVFAARSAPPWSRRTPSPFWIHGGPDGRPWCSVHPVAQDAYDVHTPEGALLARITRRPPPVCCPGPAASAGPCGSPTRHSRSRARRAPGTRGSST